MPNFIDVYDLLVIWDKQKFQTLRKAFKPIET